MKRKKTFLLGISLVIFALGMAASMFVNVLTLWANLEGQSFWGYPEALAFDTSLTTKAELSRLSCPLILAPGEAGDVALKIRNPNNDPIEAWISAHISKPGEFEDMMRELHSLPLAAGESSVLRWQVDASNIINQRMVQVRVFLRLTEHHPPARTKHCGIVFIDLWGLPGFAILLIALVGGHVFQVTGIWLWWYTRRAPGIQSQLVRNVLIALSVLSLLMSLSSFLHNWILSLVCLLLSLLIVFTTVGYHFGMFERPSN